MHVEQETERERRKSCDRCRAAAATKPRSAPARKVMIDAGIVAVRVAGKRMRLHALVFEVARLREA